MEIIMTESLKLKDVLSKDMFSKFKEIVKKLENIDPRVNNETKHKEDVALFFLALTAVFEIYLSELSKT
jgi:hypothetical protein